MLLPLETGAEARLTGVVDGAAVVCMDGGTAAEVAGTWSASVEWLVHRLAPRFPRLAFLEVRYRVKSWRRFDDCVDDAAGALAEVRWRGARSVALLGFSMGGAVSVRLAADEAVTTVIGLAPWLHPELDLTPLTGRRLAVLHGALDTPFPGVPGVRPEMSAAAVERARERGVDATRVVIPGALHAIALRAPGGRLVPMPRAGRWASLVAQELQQL